MNGSHRLFQLHPMTQATQLQAHRKPTLFTNLLPYVWPSAIVLYVLNLGVGFMAQMRWYDFGLAHHILYFFVFVSAIAATLVHFHPLLLITLADLTYMPVSKPGTWKHPAAAMVGFSGYLLPFFLGGY